MKLQIDIPDNFESDFSNDKFADFFARLLSDLSDDKYSGLCGLYETEIVEMLSKSFLNANVIKEVKDKKQLILSKASKPITIKHDCTVLLISTDGYEIETKEYPTIEDALNEMVKEYNDSYPEDNSDSYKGMSYINSDEAICYANGNDVYVWKIVKVDKESHTND